MKAWKIYRNRDRNLQNQKAQMNRSLAFQALPNPATPLTRAAIEEVSADAVVAAVGVAMAGIADRSEAESAEVIAEWTIELRSRVPRVQSSLWHSVRRNSVG